MKKTIKYGLLVLLAFTMLFILTGCGNSTIIAKGETEDPSFGKCEVKLEIKFANNKVSSIITTNTFENEMYAKALASGENDLGIKFEANGNSAVCELTSNEYKEIYGIDFSGLTREQIIERLKTEGLTVEE